MLNQKMLEHDDSWLNSLPLEYDFREYVNCTDNKDLNAFDETRARDHYFLHGVKEGRKCNRVHNRNQFRELVPKAKSILEIGPFFSPTFSKDNFNVSYLDVLSTSELRERCISIEGSNKQERVPEIDFVWSGQKYSDLINVKFDIVYSSHNVEHQPCLVRHLNDIDSILERQGVIMLVIPDKRYCFDYYLAESNITDVMQAWTEARKTHSLKNIIEHHYMTTHNDTARHWRGDHGVDPVQRLLNGSDNAGFLKSIERYLAAKEYIDVHAWKFTPKSFSTLIQVLQSIGLIKFEVLRLYPTIRNSNEFYAILKRTSV